VNPDGLNLQVLGFFDGTIDQLHLGQEPSAYKMGKKVKARILYDYCSSPPKFALALADHVVRLGPRLVGDKTEGVQQQYPVGTVLESVKVLRAEVERGLIVEVAPGVEGFVHVCTAPSLLG
jgi:rRNA biogenesis protein RRP5